MPIKKHWMRWKAATRLFTVTAMPAAIHAVDPPFTTAHTNPFAAISTVPGRTGVTMPAGPVRMTVQGKEFATWVKVKGQWLYKARYVGLSEPPAGWKE